MNEAGKVLLAVGIVATALANSEASAQPAVDLTGTYRCVQGCTPGFENQPAYVTQNGSAINIVTESGQPSQAWSDWFAPTSRIWVETQQQGAVFSPDGLIIQFDHGAVWQRVVQPDPALVAFCARRYRSYDPITATYLGAEGLRHPCP